MIVYVIYFLLSILVLFTSLSHLDRRFFKANNSFSVHCILPKWKGISCPTDNPPSPEILQQNFYYMTKGEEAFVFASEDEQYVLKFIRLPRTLRRFSLRSSPKDKKQIGQLLARIAKVASELQRETCVEAVHLSPSSLPIPLHLIDRAKRRYLVRGEEIPFFVQRRGEPFFPYFSTCSAPEKKKLILATLSLYSSLYSKGFVDLDPIFEKNLGILDGNPMIMDVGRIFEKDDLPDRESYLLFSTHSLAVHLRANDQELHSFYEAAIESACK